MQKSIDSFFVVNKKKRQQDHANSDGHRKNSTPKKKRKLNKFSKVIKPRAKKVLPSLAIDINHKPSVLKHCEPWIEIVPKKSKKEKTKVTKLTFHKPRFEFFPPVQNYIFD